MIRKLGIKPGFRLRVWDPPENYWDLLGELPPDAKAVTGRTKDIEFAHVFATTLAGLTKGLEAARAAIAMNGMVWASWPKKASGVETELDGNVVRRTGLDAGLVDIKVCAVDETWSGLKFVYRLEDRE